jgi:hypothetical protein
MTTTMYFIFFIKLERAWGFEPPTPTLARSHANERRNRAPDSQGVRFLTDRGLHTAPRLE